MEFLENNYVVGIIIIGLVVYSACVKPSLPNFIKKIFNNPIIRLIILALILISNFKPEISVMLAIAFFITVNCITEQETLESFAQTNFCITVNGQKSCQKVDDSNFNFGILLEPVKIENTSTNMQTTNIPSPRMQMTNIPSPSMQSTSIQSTGNQTTNIPSTSILSASQSTGMQSTGMQSTVM